MCNNGQGIINLAIKLITYATAMSKALTVWDY